MNKRDGSFYEDHGMVFKRCHENPDGRRVSLGFMVCTPNPDLSDPAAAARQIADALNAQATTKPSETQNV